MMPSNESLSCRLLKRSVRISAFVVVFAVLIFSLLLSAASNPANAGTPIRLHGYVPDAAAIAFRQGAVPSNQQMRLSIVLPLRNQAALSSLLHSLYDPKDPLYGHYITPSQFTQQFGPTESDIQTVTRFAASKGLTVTDVSANHTIVHVTGPASAVENAFSVHLWNYTQGNQKSFFAPSNDPVLPADVAGKINGVVGLDNAKVYHPTLVRRNPLAASSMASPAIGNGPQGSGLTPADIKNAYNLTGVTVNDQGTTNLDGTGQTMGLLELDNYTTSDITTYETQYALPNVPLQIVPVDGGFGNPGANADEVTLDIELQMALAPKVTKILVYESPDTGQGFLDILAKIASDNLANCISVSWGSAEGTSADPTFTAESQSFQQMESQGQSVFVSSGDFGAFTDQTQPTTPIVDDPANNPDATGVGGTSLFLNAGGSYNHESTWNELALPNGAGGGGISSFVGIPDYQKPVVDASADTELSKTNRNVPDVSLDADPDVSGYSFFFNGAWAPEGGTSASAPLWAAFTALVNQQRQANGGANIGFVNPSLYTIAQLPTNYAADFHDINDNSTNGFYHAETGYDDATGLGSFNGQNLLFDPNMSLALSSTITGTVTTSGSTPVPNAQIIETLASTGQVVQTATTDNTGAYSIAAPANLEVKLDAKSEGLFEQAPIFAQINGQGQTLANQDFTMLVSPHTFLNDGTPLGIQMVSSPFIYQAGLSMSTILGAPSLKAAVWVPTLGQLNDYVVAPLFPADTFRLGQGYWISVPKTAGFFSISQPGQLSIAPTTTLNLSSGWNMIGDPYDATIAVSGITASINGGAIEPYSTAEANNSLSIFYTWQAGDTAYETINGNGSLQPWEGYWIFAKFPSTITIPGPS